MLGLCVEQGKRKIGGNSVHGDKGGSAAQGVDIRDSCTCDIAALDVLNSSFRNVKNRIRTSHCMKRIFLHAVVLHARLRARSEPV